MSDAGFILLSIERVDWPELHDMFKARDANTRQRQFPDFRLESVPCICDSPTLFHDVDTPRDSRCVIKAKHVLLVY